MIISFNFLKILYKIPKYIVFKLSNIIFEENNQFIYKKYSKKFIIIFLLVNLALIYLTFSSNQL